MSDLILGWQVTPNLEPRYWMTPDASRIGFSDTDLFRVSPAGIGSHTAIIAQSGSGKSFFLGRVVEEILLRTKARCLIFDPNADFRRLHEVEQESLWADTSPYNVRTRAGKITHEQVRADFLSAWNDVSIVIRVGSPVNEKPYQQLQLAWPAVSADFLSEDLEPVQRSELYHCHEFVRAVYVLLTMKPTGDKKIDYLGRIESLLSQAMSSPADFINAMRDEFLDEPVVEEKPHVLGVFFFRRPSGEVTQKLMKRIRERHIQQASAAARYVSPEVKRYYFGRLAEFRAAQIIDERSGQSEKASHDLSRVEVLDLPSLSSPTARLLAMSAVLATEWNRARSEWSAALSVKNTDEDKRVPTFVIVDEAHNVIPHEARSKAAFALREQFRTIIAEGRKYGLFLILVSQRPDKLDPLVVSECENRAVMRMTSAAALDKTREMLALDDIPSNILAKCLDMPIGRALLAGPWSPDGPEFMYAAARRTVEGGRNLRVRYWGTETKPSSPRLTKPPLSSTSTSAVAAPPSGETASTKTDKRAAAQRKKASPSKKRPHKAAKRQKAKSTRERGA